MFLCKSCSCNTLLYNGQFRSEFATSKPKNEQIQKRRCSLPHRQQQLLRDRASQAIHPLRQRSQVLPIVLCWLAAHPTFL